MDICIFFLNLYSGTENMLGDLVVTINLDITTLVLSSKRGKMGFKEYVCHIVETDAIKEALK